MRFIVLLGVVSLFADMTYEGARSATGPFLLTLGASGAVVGLAAGLGELAGYAIRLVSGVAADRTRRYWMLTGLGYTVNLLAVPLLALAGGWPVAVALVVLERVGKAIRTPSRDVMLSFASRAVGRGVGFGLHEALDQIGAVAGPLIVAAAVFRGEGYRAGFAALALPATLALMALASARLAFPSPTGFEGPPPSAASRAGAGAAADRPVPGRAFSRAFWLYVAFASVSTMGFAHFQLISFHAKKLGLMADAVIPLAFAAAMAADAAAALAAGRGYDRLGLRSLVILPLGTAAAAVLAFSGGAPAVWGGVLLWGVALGVQESVMRAAVADLAPIQVRGSAYGAFNAAFGAAWFAGSAAMGLLYDRSPAWAAAFAAVAQLASLPLLAAAVRTFGKPTGSREHAGGGQPDA